MQFSAHQIDKSLLRVYLTHPSRHRKENRPGKEKENERSRTRKKKQKEEEREGDKEEVKRRREIRGQRRRGERRR